jgi:hypothetical protein
VAELARKERTCATEGCGRVFTATNLYCTRCQTTERRCQSEGCGRTFWSPGSQFCSRHRYSERDCATNGCPNRFTAPNRFCSACRSTSRECASEGCDNIYVGTGLKCRDCSTPVHECVAKGCATVFRGTQSRCWAHRSKLRECASTDCTNTYRGTTIRCVACRTIERECDAKDCTEIYWGDRRLCPGCRKSDRICPDCGQDFRGRTTRCGPCWWRQLPAAVREAVTRSRGNARRARLLEAQVTGPVSTAEYTRIRDEGPCVYCSSQATEVDHIRPLATHGGWEHPSNLVPACRYCNASKSNRLLIEWDPRRVFRAVKSSPKVAAEYERQLVEAGAELLQSA